MYEMRERKFPQQVFVCVSIWLFLLGSIECKRQVGLGWRQYWRYIKGRGNIVFSLASLFRIQSKSGLLILMLCFKRFCAFSYQKEINVIYECKMSVIRRRLLCRRLLCRRLVCYVF